MGNKNTSYAKWGYMFSLPFILVFLVFSLYPIIYTAMLGFTDLQGAGRKTFEFLSSPFENYKIVLTNESFITSLKNTGLIWFLNFIPQILLALLLTSWFTNHRYKIKGQGLFKVLMYMPNIITAATIAFLFRNLFGYPKGPINDLFLMLGLIDEPIYFWMSAGWSRGIIAFIQFWMWYGNTMIVLIAGVMGIDPTIFEAAEIDGASDVQTFFKITLPSLRTILLFTLVTSLIGGLQMFDIPLLYNLGGPDQKTLTSSVWIYNQAFSGRYFYNRASAASMVLFSVIVVLASLIFYILRDKDAEKIDKMKKQMRKAAKKAQKEASK